MAKDFNPNKFSFEEGIKRVDEALQSIEFDMNAQIFTSRDEVAHALTRNLLTDNIPDGFHKWQLPLYFQEPGAQIFFSVSGPGVSVDEHSHDEGPGLRIIISGSINYKGQELSSGDWMYIPAGKPYSFDVGDLGVVMCYCYQCCCA